MSKTDWIQTFTGKKFFPLAPDADAIDIVDIAHALANQCRFNGHSKKFYSVAEHSAIAATLCKSDRYLAKYMLLHDAAEAYLSDIPRPLKVLPEFGFYREAEGRLQAMIYEKFGLAPIEPSGVKDLDKQMLREEAMSPALMWPLHPDWQDRCDPILAFSNPMPPDRAERWFLELFGELFAPDKFDAPSTWETFTQAELVAEFNKCFPIGSTIYWRSVDSPGSRHMSYKVRYEALLMSGQPVCFVERWSGAISIEPRFVDYMRSIRENTPRESAVLKAEAAR